MTPIVYPFELLADKLADERAGPSWLPLLNPITPIVLAFQRAIYGGHRRPGDGGADCCPTRRSSGTCATSAIVGAGRRAVLLWRRHHGLRPARGQLRRGALSVATAIEVQRRLQALPAQPRAALVAEGAGDPPRPPPPRRGLLGAARHRPRGRARARRSACSATTARASRRCSSASAGSCSRPPGEIRTRGRLAVAARAGRRLPPRPHRPGERLPERLDPRAVAARTSTRRFDEIVDFAELEQFIDHQVKHYSSGMYVRLGFAVAINVDPDILLVDEVLAVGDEAFQRKCLDRVRQFQREGRTIVFVTHARRPGAPDLRPGRGARPRARWSTSATRRGRPHVPRDAARRRRGGPTAKAERDGAVAETDGSAPTAATPVEDLDRGTARSAGATCEVRITEVDASSTRGGERPYLLPGEPLTIRVGFDAAERGRRRGVRHRRLRRRRPAPLRRQHRRARPARRSGRGRGRGALRRSRACRCSTAPTRVTSASTATTRASCTTGASSATRFQVMNPGRAAGCWRCPCTSPSAGAAVARGDRAR